MNAAALESHQNTVKISFPQIFGRVTVTVTVTVMLEQIKRSEMVLKHIKCLKIYWNVSNVVKWCPSIVNEGKMGTFWMLWLSVSEWETRKRIFNHSNDLYYIHYVILWKNPIKYQYNETFQHQSDAAAVKSKSGMFVIFWLGVKNRSKNTCMNWSEKQMQMKHMWLLHGAVLHCIVLYCMVFGIVW